MAKNILDLLGRIFISIIFFYEAYDSIAFAKDTKELMSQYGLNWAQDTLLIASVVLLILGAVLILLGYRVTLGCVLLLLYWIPVTFIAYSFWDSGEELRRLHSIIFMKNIAIVGGLFFLMIPTNAKFRLRRIFQAAKLSKPDWSDTI